MTGNTLGWVIVAFVLYLLMMIAIGAFYAKGNNNSEDYFLGGRKLNGFVAALSAQASDMSGWLLMGLPGAIYLTGVGGDGWIAIGLFIGTTLTGEVVYIERKKKRWEGNAHTHICRQGETDRKSVVQGKSVDLGGRRIIKKKFF